MVGRCSRCTSSCQAGGRRDPPHQRCQELILYIDLCTFSAWSSLPFQSCLIGVLSQKFGRAARVQMALMLRWPKSSTSRFHSLAETLHHK